MKNRKRVLYSIGLLAALALLAFSIGFLAVNVSADSHQEPVEMGGYSFFNGELIETGYVISDEALNSCEAKATLVHLEDEQYELRVGEICGFGPRLTIWDLTISEAGEVGGTFHAQTFHPASETGSPMGEIWLHTGCMMVGDFPALTGTWDGETLRAYTSFEGRCNGGTMWGEPEIMGFLSGDTDPDGPIADGLDWNDGPARMEFGVDLSVEPIPAK